MKKTPNGQTVLTVSIAVDDGADPNGNRRTMWIPVEMWGKTAEYIAEKCHKGDTVGVAGKLAVRQYTDRNGTNRELWKVVADSVSKLKDNPNNVKKPEEPKPKMLTEEYSPGFTITEDDLPF